VNIVLPNALPPATDTAIHAVVYGLHRIVPQFADFAIVISRRSLAMLAVLPSGSRLQAQHAEHVLGQMPGELVAELGFIVAASARPPRLAGVALHLDITFIMNTPTGTIRVGAGWRSVRRFEIRFLEIILCGTLIVV
jgi:hypothetical protein